MVKSFCYVSDRNLASEMNQGRFDLEDCGMLQTCSQEVEQCDYNISPECLMVAYCEINWVMALPVILVGLLVLYFVITRFRRFMGYSSSSSAPIDESRHRHRRFSKY